MAIRSKKTITAVSPTDSPGGSADALPKEQYLFSAIYAELGVQKSRQKRTSVGKLRTTWRY
jgi:hypothetical protein